MYNHEPHKYNCPFCRIINGIDDKYTLTNQDDIFYQDENITAFISAGWFGINNGHILIVPNIHYENIYDIPDDIISRIYVFAKKVAIAIREKYKCDGISTRQHNEPSGNQDVWHYHVHVFPRYKDDKLYKQNRYNSKPENRIHYANILKSYFNNL